MYIIIFLLLEKNIQDYMRIISAFRTLQLKTSDLFSDSIFNYIYDTRGNFIFMCMEQGLKYLWQLDPWEAKK